MKLDRLIIADIKRRAEIGTWDGHGISPYFDMCRTIISDQGVVVVFTRDVGMHSGGWFKNPLFERCYHLSVSFFDPDTTDPRPRDLKATLQLLKILFGKHRDKVWSEPPDTAISKQYDVWHYRLFCNEGWNPIKPEGEVYSTEFTPRGWKSFSELNDEYLRRRKQLMERADD